MKDSELDPQRRDTTTSDRLPPRLSGEQLGSSAMRQKLRSRRAAATPIQGDPTAIDMSDTARQLAFSETGNGWQHGVLEILVALLAAVTFVPIRPFPPSGLRFRDARSGTRERGQLVRADRGIGLVPTAVPIEAHDPGHEP